MSRTLAATLVLGLVASAGTAQAQQWMANAHIIVPQARAFQPDVRGPALDVTGVTVGVLVDGQVATTSMAIDVANPGAAIAEARMLVPVPDGAVVRSFDFQGAGSEPSAELLPHAEARRTYDAIVARTKDPALLEFVGARSVRSSVFPVPARGTQRVRLVWEQVLTAEDARVDYVLPRSESVSYRVPWDVAVRIQGSAPVSTVYSPSHRIDTARRSPSRVSVRLDGEAATDPGPFRLSWLLERDDVTASLVAYPDPARGGGWFLLLGGLPAEARPDRAPIDREVTIVIDRSGSMRADGKLDQAKAAARRIVESLREGERFNLIAYGNAVDRLAVQPIEKTEETARLAGEWLDMVTPGGGTNIHDALVAALTPPAPGDALPLVLFLTDGLPTVGRTSERQIRELVTRGNRAGRRIFTVGVGADVNTPLLTALATDTRATATFVLPDEDVEARVASVFRRLGEPVMASPEVRIVDAADPNRVRGMELQPSALPDLFDGDQVVLLGRYTGTAPLRVELRGQIGGQERGFAWDFDLDRSSVSNAYVPRLWASRRIAELVDLVRAAGADGGTADARTRELVEEIVALSTEYGVLTEYTAFFAAEGTDLMQPDEVLRQAMRNFDDQGLRTRWGLGSVSQSLNNDARRYQTSANYRNEYWNEHMEAVEVTSVQQIGDRAYYRNGAGEWVDSRLVGDRAQRPAVKEVGWGSLAWHALVATLTASGRQGALSLDGPIVLDVGGQSYRVQPPG